MKNFVFLVVLFIPIFISSCSAQNKSNPKYLGKEYGHFDLANVTFDEDIDTLFSKIEPIKLVDDKGYFDKKKNRYVKTDTIAYVYKLKKKDRSKVDFRYLSFKMGQDNLMTFHTTNRGALGYISSSSYTSKEHLDNLTNRIKKKYNGDNLLSKDLPDNSKVLQFKNDSKKTTIIYLKNKEEGPNRKYYVEINIINLDLKDQEFINFYDDFNYDS